ncbi:uncharacterized protein LOC112576465 isoform X2 [Pomacea canaliculata]|uniref:uncharacterized protein LOC112576465 isoform X2 n=1 Tax=Pomacea canaliculata TaxID=400727 RepID=UPI000D73FF34|nr:uncharacterized protein LOC112576465 isoform X2 [Pomacea canaliculata]
MRLEPPAITEIPRNRNVPEHQNPEMAHAYPQLIDIEILKCQNPSFFLGRELTVVPIVDNANYFQEEMLKWSDELESTEDQITVNHNPHVGEICATKNSNSIIWSRVKVTKIFHTLRGDQAQCYFVDTGETKQVPIYRLRKLPDKFIMVPFQVRTMKLAKIQPLSLQMEVTNSGLTVPKRPSSKWDPSAVVYFQNLVARSKRSRVEVMEITDEEDAEDVQHVRLYLFLDGEELCINDMLVHKEYAVYSTTNTQVSSSERSTRHFSPEPEHFTSIAAIQEDRVTSARGYYTDTETSFSDQRSVEKRKALEDCRSFRSRTSSCSSTEICPISPAVITASAYNKHYLPDSGKVSPVFSPLPVHTSPPMQNKDSSSDICKNISKTISPTGSLSAFRPCMSHPEDKSDEKISRIDRASDGAESASQVIEREMVSSTGRRLLGKRVLNQIGRSSDGDISACHLPRLCRADRQTPKPFLGVYVWGNMTRNPVFQLCDIHFDGVISEHFIKENFKTPLAIQAYSWPYIMQCRHVVGIAPAQAGKTLSYLPAVLTLLLQSSSYSKLPPGVHPKCLVLVPTWKKAQEVVDLANEMLQGKTTLTCLAIYAGRCEENQVIPLIRGCDLLVATPNCLLRMLDRRYTNLSQLCHLVLDDAEVLCEQFTSEINEVMTRYAHMLEKHCGLAVPRQILVYSCQWTPGVADFQEKFQKNSIKVFASRMEASVYGRVKQVVHMCLNRAGLKRFTELMVSLMASSYHRIVVITEESENLEKIAKLLQRVNVDFIMITPELTSKPHDLEEYVERWQNMSGSSVLVLTDETVNDLSVTCADVVVHFDIPRSKTLFGNRLVMMLDNFCDPEVVNNSMGSKSKKQAVSHILVKESCQMERVHSLYDFLTRNASCIPPDMEAFIKGMLEGLNTDDKKPLCKSVKAYGFCSKGKCLDRHLVMTADKGDDSWLPDAGEVKMKVCHVIDTSHYFVRLLEHCKEDRTVQNYRTNCVQLIMDLALFFLEPQNVSPYSLTQDAGQLAVVRDVDGAYHRARVLKQEEVKVSMKLRKVQVKYIDEGITETVSVDQLLKLPHQFQSVPPQAVEVFICRVKPTDGDTEWSERSIKFMEEILSGEILVGRIVLKMKNTLWLDPVGKETRLKTLKTHIITMFARNELINHHLADDNPEHIKNLYKLCEGKIQVPKKLIQKYFSLPAEQFIDTECLKVGDDFYEVCISVVDTPDHFFVQKWGNLEELEKMVLKLTEHVEKATQPRLLNTDTSSEAIPTPELETINFVAKPDVLKDAPLPTSDLGTVVTATCAENGSHVPSAHTETVTPSATLGDTGSSQQTTSESSGATSSQITTHDQKKKEDFEPGSVCAACFPQDRRWYRGRLQQRLEGGWQVFFIDYGDRQFVPDGDICRLPNIFCEMPAQAIECSLAYVRSRGSEWSNESVEALCDMSHYMTGEKKLLVAKVIDVDEADCAGQKKFVLDIFDTNISSRDLRLSQELINLRLAQCKDEQKLEYPFPKVTFSRRKLYPSFEGKVSDICAALYWSETEDQAGSLSQELASLLDTKEKMLEIFMPGALRTTLKLIGYLWSCDAHATVLTAVVQCIKWNPSFCTAGFAHEIVLHLLFCLEQVQRPMIQSQAAKAAVDLVKIQHSVEEKYFWEYMDQKEIISIFCDVLHAQLDAQVIVPVCFFLTEMFGHSEICKNVVKTQCMDQAVELLTQWQAKESVEVTEAILALLEAAATWDKLHPYLLREAAIQCVVTTLRKEPSHLSIFYSASICQQLCQASRKNKRILLESELVPIVKDLLTRGLQSPALEMCQELEASLSIHFPQQEVLAGKHASQIQSPETHSVKVRWSQSSFRLHLTVLLRGAKAEDFTIQDDRVCCWHLKNNQPLGFDYRLFDKIQPEKCQIKVGANDVRLTLTKQQKGKWSRLLKEKQKHPLVTVDFDNLKDSSESEEENDKTGSSHGKVRLPVLEEDVKRECLSLSDDSSQSQDDLVSSSDDERF